MRVIVTCAWLCLGAWVLGLQMGESRWAETNRGALKLAFVLLGLGLFIVPAIWSVD